MKVALTGATGYTGGRLLAVLLGRGDAVRALARPSSKRPALSAEPAWIEGDLADVGALNRLVEGVDAVVHVAAVYRTAGHTDAYYRAVNVEGTLRLLEAAVRAGVKRFVHTSTVGHLRTGRDAAAEALPRDRARPLRDRRLGTRVLPPGLHRRSGRRVPARSRAAGGGGGGVHHRRAELRHPAGAGGDDRAGHRRAHPAVPCSRGAPSLAGRAVRGGVRAAGRGAAAAPPARGVLDEEP